MATKSHPAAQLRIAALVILCVGLPIAAFLFFSGPPDLTGSADADYYKKDVQGLQGNYGNAGSLMAAIYNLLQQPSVQALLVLTVSGAAALACFFFASRMDGDRKKIQI